MRHLLSNSLIIVCATIITLTEVEPFLTRNAVSTMSTLQFEAIYQFGDSLSDTGNLVRESNRGDCSYARLPYGQTFFHRATGRCSDGLLMVDFFAIYFHLPLLNPILEKGGDFRNGANFAVAGATALDTTTLASINITSTVTYSSLSTQIVWFRSLLSSFCPNSTDCERSLEKSLVLLGEIGGNDYNFAFSQGKTMEQVYALVPQVVQTIKDTVIELIGLGVTNIVVPGNFPIGCVPLYLFQFETNDTSKYDELHCLKEYNEFSQFHNRRLVEAIQELQDQYPNVAIAYADYYSALTWVISNSFALGFEDGPEKACCSAGDNPYNYDPSRSCGSPGVPVCSNPAKRVSWDGIHLTQEGYRYVARWLLGQFLPELARQRRVRD
ncbi:acetylajmalan esterase-like [Silene latifolia]|uniref:acetylajmalan esterase-like n=1 Tax=Silene latifolia TaxID=37657 RepID=UPI003D777136